MANHLPSWGPETFARQRGPVVTSVGASGAPTFEVEVDDMVGGTRVAVREGWDTSGQQQLVATLQTFELLHGLIY